MVELLEFLATLSTFITTVSSTFLVALKIILVTRKSPMRNSYAKIIEIVIESAAIVSIVFLGPVILALSKYPHPFSLRTPSGRATYQTFLYLTFIQAPIMVRIPHCIHHAYYNTGFTGNCTYTYCLPCCTGAASNWSQLNKSERPAVPPHFQKNCPWNQHQQPGCVNASPVYVLAWNLFHAQLDSTRARCLYLTLHSQYRSQKFISLPWVYIIRIGDLCKV